MAHIDLSQFLGKVRCRVYRVGLELEGGWKKLPEGVRSLHPDTSVYFPEFGQIDGRHAPDLTTYPTAPKFIGELPSPKLLPLKSKRTGIEGTPLDFQTWLRRCHPQFVNQTCGLHVHMSFLSAFTYQRLMDQRFQDTVIHYLTVWAKTEGLPLDHPIWPRLQGKSEYCQHKNFADVQAQFTQKNYERNDPRGHRYTFLNYAFSRLGTVECRGLPMFSSVDLSIEAVQALLDITSSFLVATAKEDLKGKKEAPTSLAWIAEDVGTTEQLIVEL